MPHPVSACVNCTEINEKMEIAVDIEAMRLTIAAVFVKTISPLFFFYYNDMVQSMIVWFFKICE